MPREIANPAISVLVTLVSVLFLPYGYAETVGLGSSNCILAAIFWEYVSSFYSAGFRIPVVGSTMAALVYTALRFLVVFQVYRYYRGRSTRGQTIAFAAISELPPLLISTPAVLGILLMPAPFYDFVLPLPTLLLFVLALVNAFSPKRPDTAWEDC